MEEFPAQALPSARLLHTAPCIIEVCLHSCIKYSSRCHESCCGAARSAAGPCGEVLWTPGDWQSDRHQCGVSVGCETGTPLAPVMGFLFPLWMRISSPRPEGVLLPPPHFCTSCSYICRSLSAPAAEQLSVLNQSPELKQGSRMCPAWQEPIAVLWGMLEHHLHSSHRMSGHRTQCRCCSLQLSPMVCPMVPCLRVLLESAKLPGRSAFLSWVQIPAKQVEKSPKI